MLTREAFNNPKLVFSQEAEEQLAKCIKFVNEKRPDLEENLVSRFKYLADRKDGWVNVHSDFAPLSFYFVVMWLNPKTNKYERDYNGGVIFHGAHDGGGSGKAPTYSVTGSPVDGWAVHT